MGSLEGAWFFIERATIQGLRLGRLRLHGGSWFLGYVCREENLASRPIPLATVSSRISGLRSPSRTPCAPTTATDLLYVLGFGLRVSSLEEQDSLGDDFMEWSCFCVLLGSGSCAHVAVCGALGQFHAFSTCQWTLDFVVGV